MWKRAVILVLLVLLPGLGFWAGRAEAQATRVQGFTDDSGYYCEAWRDEPYGRLFCQHPTKLPDGTTSYYECWFQQRVGHLEMGCRSDWGLPWRQAVPAEWKG